VDQSDLVVIPKINRAASYLVKLILPCVLIYVIMLSVSDASFVSAQTNKNSNSTMVLRGGVLGGTDYPLNGTYSQMVFFSGNVGKVQTGHSAIIKIFEGGLLYKIDLLPPDDIASDGSFSYQTIVKGKLGLGGKIVFIYGNQTAEEILPYAHTGIPPTSNCSSEITTEEQTLSASVNKNRAIAFTTMSDDFTSTTSSWSFEFDSIGYQWSADEHTCSVTLKNVNVVFRLASYCCGENVVFQLNPTLNMITGITHSGVTCGTFCPAMPSPSFSFCGSSNQTTICEPSPLKQFKSGSRLNAIHCSDYLSTLVIKTKDDSPACVKLQTAQKLVERGWGIMIAYFKR